MNLLWAVPVVAVAVAAGLVLVRVRAIEQACLDLVVATRRTGELQVSLAAVRRELRRSGPLVDRVWSHWDPGDEPDDKPDDDPGTSDDADR